jgi:hypothetical protein
MNEELSAALTAIIERVGSGVDFVIAEAPEVVRQLLTYATIEHSVYVAIWLTLFVVAWVAGVIMLREGFRLGNVEGAKHDAGEGEIVFGICSIIIGVLMLFPLVLYTLTLIKIIVAPTVYLLEYAAKLL